MSENVASLVLDMAEAHSSIDEMSRDQLIELVRRLNLGISAISAKRSLSVEGKPGDIVEFSSNAHEFIKEGIPSETQVRMVRPMIVRSRNDGSKDILIKAVVDEVE